MIKEVEGFPDYMITDDGRIFSKKVNRYLKPTRDGKDYCQIKMFKDKKRSQKQVHRLVAEAFIPNPDNKPFVNHLDGDKNNNDMTNLEWVTASENMTHAYKTGLKTITSRMREAMRSVGSLSAKKVINIRTGETYRSVSEAAKHIGIPAGTLFSYLSGRYPNKTDLRYYDKRG